MTSIRNRIVAAALAVVAVWSVSCGTDHPTAVQRGYSLATQQAFLAKALPHGREDLVWLGATHNKAMEELVATKKTWNHKSRGSRAERKCRAVSDLTVRYAAIVAQRLALQQSDVDKQIAGALKHAGCPGGKPGKAGKQQSVVGNGSMIVAPMALWRTRFLAAKRFFEDEETVTGAYNNYIPAMESAINNASTGSEAAAEIDHVLSTAASANIGQGDMTMLNAIGSVGAASVLYWYDYEASGQLDRDKTSISQYETAPGSQYEPTMSIYRSMGWLHAFGMVGWADLIGAAAGAASACTWTGGTCVLVPAVAMAGATIWAVAGSAGTIVGLLYAM